MRSFAVPMRRVHGLPARAPGRTPGRPDRFLFATSGSSATLRACVDHQPGNPLHGITLAAMIVFGLGRGFADANLMPIVCQVVDARYRASAYGVLVFISVMVGGGMIYVGGWLRDRQVALNVPFMIAAVGLLAAGLMLLIVRTPKSERGE